MTTSPKPWSCRTIDAINYSKRGELLDRHGRHIAFFVNLEDAKLVISLMSHGKKTQAKSQRKTA